MRPPSYLNRWDRQVESGNQAYCSPRHVGAGPGEGNTLVKPETRASFSPHVVDGLVDAVVLVDDHGAVLYANPALQRLLGWDVRSLFGTAFTNLFPDRQRDEIKAGLDDLVHADTVPRQ